MSRLDTNLALFAGAGTGKTHALMTMCLHLLAGIRGGRLSEPLPVSQLTLVTFTDKAAAELRARLRARVDKLCEGAADEPQLKKSFEALKGTLPPVSHWRAVRSQLASASIGTFHSLCLRLLKQAPGHLGLGPSVEVLDERDAANLLKATVERWVIARLEENTPWVADLVVGLEYAGLVEGLVDVFRRAREDGVSFETLPIGDAAQSRRDFDAKRAEFRSAFEAEKNELKPPTRKAKGELEYAPAYDEAIRLLDNSSIETFLRDAATLVNTFKYGKRGRIRDRVAELGDIAAGFHTAPYEARVREALNAIGQAYARALQQRQAIDFTDIMVRCRDLLRDEPTFRLAAQRELGALLVDEFQDTNRVQLEVVRLLAQQRGTRSSDKDRASATLTSRAVTSKRAGSVAPVSTHKPSQLSLLGLGLDFGVSPKPWRPESGLEPEFLAIVGDRKQAIYDFRGADVGVFEMMAKEIEEGGGKRDFLTTSRRASPDLVAVFNAVFPSVLGAPEQTKPYDVVYEPAHDDMQAHRPNTLSVRALVQLRSHRVEDTFQKGKGNGEKRRQAEADGLARYLNKIFTDGVARVVDAQTDEPRPAKPGDVAMLFRSFTQVEVYRRALIAHRIPHRVVRGRGFHAAQEVVDVASWLNLLSDATDAVALAAVLRSPLVGLSDTALLRAAEACGGKLDASQLFSAQVLKPFSEVLSAGERQRLLHAAEVYERYRHLGASAGLAHLIESSLHELGFQTALAASPFGEQALLNLETVISLAQTADEGGRISLAEFADGLRRSSESEEKDPRDDAAHTASADAVWLLTAHQAKGLEWPIVVLPDLMSTPPLSSKKLLFDRDVGLALKPWTQEWEKLSSTQYQRVNGERQLREKAQARRLLYVAMTRARDQVVLGPALKEASNAWSTQLALALEHPAVRAHLDDTVQVDMLPAGSETMLSIAPNAESETAVAQTVARVRGVKPVTSTSAMLSVTQLQDFAACPRRYHLTHEVGVQGTAMPSVRGSSLTAEEAREQGIAAHSVLQQVEWSKVARGKAAEAIGETAAQLGVPLDAPWLPWLERFLASPLGQELAERGEAHVYRELPFVVTLNDARTDFRLSLRGQFDVLMERADQSALVLDYKTTVAPADGAAAHAFQLASYALAARRLLKPGTPLQLAAVFLQEDNPAPALYAVDPQDNGARLVAMAQQLISTQAQGKWSSQPLPACQAMKCPHILRCHGTKARLHAEER